MDAKKKELTDKQVLNSKNGRSTINLEKSIMEFRK